MEHNEAVKSTVTSEHDLILQGREELSLTGVTEVQSFDDRCIALYTKMGELIVRGRELHINSVSVETGNMSISGEIWGLNYGDKDRRSSPSFLGKLFR